ncbi:MAG: aspartate dehydrogenase [Woeseiaceae bacterium]|nr:aspartate dehydrogenase [Woeseiaceae bacterium]
MQTILIIGCGAIAEAVVRYLAGNEAVAVAAAIVEPGTEAAARGVFGDDVALGHGIDDIGVTVDLAVDCAGHPALRQHGAAILSRGTDLITVSAGALGDADLYERLASAARQGESQLRVVSGAIGALDVLASADIGNLATVTYRGRKPPRGWRGSPAEDKLDLAALTEPAVHFSGSARDAALEYPKNANVAAAVALAGTGLDETTVELIADPGVERNIHEVIAEGDFGRFEFCVEGRSLPDNPRSSALAAMSVVREIIRTASTIVI